MNKPLFTLIFIFLISFSFNALAAPNSVAETVLNTAANATTYLTGSTILDALIPSRKNCNYVDDKTYQPFSDIKSDFPGTASFMSQSKKDKSVDCINVANGTENLLRLLFTTTLSLIIVMTVISISVAGIQYMTEQATGQIKGGARKRLLNSFIALGLALLSYAILYTINKQLVNFTFNPTSVDVNNAISRGIMDANIAALTSGSVSGLVDAARPIENNGVGLPVSPTGYVNKLTGAPCTPFVGPPAPGAPADPCVKQDSLLGAYAAGIPTGSFGAWNETTAENWVRTLSNGVRATDGRLVVSVFSSSRDLVTDIGTSQRRGNADNLLREGSVALSPDLISRYRPQTGQEIFINGVCIGFYEDATAGEYKGVTFNNTVDIYDENGTLGSYLKNIPVGQWTISFGNTRPQITNLAPLR